MGDNGNQKKNKIDVSLGQLTVIVEGTDEEWVEEQFEKVWKKRLDEADEMKEAIRTADRTAH